MGNTGILTKAGKQRSIATYNASHRHLLNCLLLLHILDLWKEWRPWCYEHRLSKSLFGLAIGQEGKWTYFTCSMLLIVTDQILSRRGIGSMVSLTFTNYENIVLIKKCLFKECAPLWQYSIAHKLWIAVPVNKRRGEVRPSQWGGGGTYVASLDFKACRFAYWGGNHVAVDIFFFCFPMSRPCCLSEFYPNRA